MMLSMATVPTRPRRVTKGAYRYWVTTWYDGDGVRHYHYLANAKTTKAADLAPIFDDWLRKWHNDPTLRDPSKRSTLTMEQLVDAYRKHAKAYYVKDGEATGELGWIDSATEYPKLLYGSLLVSKFGPKRLKKCRAAMIKDKLSRKGVNARVNRIRRMFRWAVDEELVRVRSWYALQAVSGLKAGRTVATETDAVAPAPEAHIEASKKKMPAAVRDMVDLQLLSGMRPGEACIMRACDLDTTGELWEYRPARFKTQHHAGSKRIILLGPRAQEIIKPLLGPKLDAYLFDPRKAAQSRLGAKGVHRREGQAPTPTPSGRKIGERYTPNTYRKAVRRACEKAEVPIWSPNQLRHNAATAARKAFGLDGAQALLGHKGADVTQVYAELDRAKAAEIMRLVG